MSAGPVLNPYGGHGFDYYGPPAPPRDWTPLSVHYEYMALKYATPERLLEFNRDVLRLVELHAALAVSGWRR